MTRVSFDAVPDTGRIDARRWARVLNGVLRGKTNNVEDVAAFDVAALPLTVNDPRVSVNSYIGLTPLNANAEYVRVSSVGDKTFTLAATQLAPMPASPAEILIRYCVIG